MGYDVCVDNSYGHCTIYCCGFRRRSESEPYGDRRKSYGNRRVSAIFKWGCAMFVRSPHDF